MQKINLNGKEALVIDVPEDARSFIIDHMGDLSYEYDITNTDNARTGWIAMIMIELPSGNWSIPGTITNGVPDFDCEGWVVKNEYGHEGYRDYVSSTDETSFNWYTASQSFISLLHSQGIDTTSKKVIIVKQ